MDDPWADWTSVQPAHDHGYRIGLLPTARPADRSLPRMLAEPQRFAEQLAAILATCGQTRPQIMIAAVADFFSIGSNDPTASILGLGRRDPALRTDRVLDPPVLAALATVVRGGAVQPYRPHPWSWWAGVVDTEAKSGAPRVLLVVVNSFVAVTAIGGGIALAAGLEGQRFPVAWLSGTPFRGYLIPGLVLVLAVGGSAALAALATARRWPWHGHASAVAGLVLIGQISGELLLLDQPDKPTPIEIGYLALGLLMLLVGLRSRAR